MNEREHQDEDASEDRGQSQKSGSLFHYTTASGLIGIISQRVLWATHANYLNDTAELKILSDLLTPQISQEFRQCIPKLIAANAFLPGLLNSYGESIYDSEARNACRAVMRAIEAVAPMYVTSFCMHAVGSEESRHGLLSQWRGYGRGGFAIEFDESELDRLTVLENTNRSIQMIATRKVEYTSHEKAANKDRFIGLGLAALSTAFREKTPNLAARADVAAILSNVEFGTYVGAFLETVPFLKTPRFQEENEYRLVVAATRPSKTSEETRATIPIHFREGAAGAVVPYIRLFETLDAKLPIKSIIVGPHRDQENQYNAVSLLLEENDLEVPVHRSDTTLRF
ncbi:DUF2971 domain-containing protein [Bradyrhizobium sp. LA7.1]|uniref:DUF2971 domain-containing protein n=1 Tax=unclassified Bradyrhizobium TaxID=2631580 RepID=UPI003397EE02